MRKLRCRRGNGDGADAAGSGCVGIVNQQYVLVVAGAAADGGNEHAFVAADGDPFRPHRQTDAAQNGQSFEIDGIERRPVVGGYVKQFIISGDSGGEGRGIGPDGCEKAALGDGVDLNAALAGVDQVDTPTGFIKDQIGCSADQRDYRPERRGERT